MHKDVWCNSSLTPGSVHCHVSEPSVRGYRDTRTTDLHTCPASNRTPTLLPPSSRNLWPKPHRDLPRCRGSLLPDLISPLPADPRNASSYLSLAIRFLGTSPLLASLPRFTPCPLGDATPLSIAAALAAAAVASAAAASPRPLCLAFSTGGGVAAGVDGDLSLGSAFVPFLGPFLPSAALF